MLTKPAREPDFIYCYHTYFWFNELIYLNCNNKLIQMLIDEDYNKLKIVNSDIILKCFRCEQCKLGLTCDRFFLNDVIQEEYRKWSDHMFESTILGDNYDA